MSRLFASVLISAALLAAPAFAQYPGGDSDSDAPADASAARLQVKISELQEQIRQLQGSIEQIGYQNQQLKAQLEKSNADTQYRLDALEKKQAAATPEPPKEDTGQLRPVESSQATNPAGDGGSVDEVSTGEAPATPSFTSARDHYNYAYKLIGQAKYAEAGAAFASFTKRYPKDALIGNAYYWLGETYYVRKDYVKAADSFRLGYESMPTGPKSGENLLKLATALNALNKDKESCVVLKQVVAKYGSSSSSLKPRATQEMNRIGCN